VNSRTIASNYIKDKNARILELGPLNRSLLDRKKYKNYFFADIHSTEEVKELYSGSNYLKRTGIVVDLEDIIPIDYVVKDTYKETFKDLEKFDYVIASHVLEHMPNLLNFFFDVQNILTEDGELIIIYPDKRFCFDHFRSESKFADIYDIWKTSEVGNPRQTLDFFTNVLHENNAVKFWDMDEEIPMYNGEDVKNNLQRYPMWKKGMLEKMFITGHF
jgi:predicted SAM-dependent methyltransferase